MLYKGAGLPPLYNISRIHLKNTFCHTSSSSVQAMSPGETYTLRQAQVTTLLKDPFEIGSIKK
jgi:hypothetical protein